MNFSNPKADIFVPDASDSLEALKKTTHLCLGAHQDDLEIFAYHGIAECYRQKDKWFSGVVVTNGAGSSRSGVYADCTDEEMQEIRTLEQRKAASIGEYGIQIQLAHPSSVIKDNTNVDTVNDIRTIIEIAQPEVVYLHNPADKHPTHIAVLMRCIQAIRSLPLNMRPKIAYGCEVWRDLDWLLDSDKQALDVSAFPNLAATLVGVFDSQITGGKRYDLATSGRRLANATYFDSHSSDSATELTWAIDLSPVIQDDSIDLATYTLEYIDRFKNDVSTNIANFSS